jgi:hypothetical protein
VALAVLLVIGSVQQNSGPDLEGESIVTCVDAGFTMAVGT